MKFPVVLMVIVCLSCERSNKQKPLKGDDFYFEATISPAFDEHAKVMISKIGNTQTINFLLRDAYGDDKPADTFYFRKAELKQNQFRKIEDELLQKIFTKRSIQNTGIRDGIWFGFTIIQQGDTSNWIFDNPHQGRDSAAIEIIKKTIVNFQSIFNDTIVNDYLYEVQTYIDDSISESPLKGLRTIDKLRRKKYSR